MTASRRKALFLAHRLPYPPDKGDKMRSFRELRALAEDHDVTLGCFLDDPDDARHLPAVEEMCSEMIAVPLRAGPARARALLALLSPRPLSLAYYRSRELRRRLLGRPAFDVVVAFSSTMAPFADACQARRRVLDLCDLDSEKWALFADASRFPRSFVYRLEASRLGRFEAKCCRRFDSVVLVSAAEACALRARAPDGPIHVVPNGIDLEYYDPARVEARGDGKTAVFCGAMDYRSNVDAVVRYATAIHPRVRRRVPDARFKVVGSRPAPEVLALATIEGVSVTGRVPDVRPELLSCAVSVAPLRLGRGVPNKVLEALALGLPVVTTSNGAAGIELARFPGASVADEPERFADEVVRFLEAARAGRDRYPQHRSELSRLYCWDAFTASIRSLAGATGPSAVVGGSR